MSNELEQAKKHLADALEKSNAADAAVGAARTEEVRLAGAVAAALAAERIEAESSEPTKNPALAALTARVRDAQDAARLHQYRLKRLETDAAMAQSDYTDRFVVLQKFELQAAHAAAAVAAQAWNDALDAAAQAKRQYIASLAPLRAGEDAGSYEPANIGRVIRWSVTIALLETELCGGKDYNGRPIESAADIRKEIGYVSHMPLLS